MKVELTDSQRVVNALKKVPEKRLAIIDLVWVALNDKGEPNYEVIVDRATEIGLAVKEAQAYATATENAVNALLRKL